MLSVVSVILGVDSEKAKLTNSSVRYASGREGHVCEPESLAKFLEDREEDVVHLIAPGGIVLPQFFRAFIVSLEGSGKDYAFCPCLLVSNGSMTEVRPTGDVAHFGQMMVRRWVLQELGVGKGNIPSLYNRVVSEYRGTEIPHHLYMEIG